MLTAKEARDLTNRAIKEKQDKEIVLVNSTCTVLDKQIIDATSTEQFSIQVAVANMTEFQKNKLLSYYQKHGYDCRYIVQSEDNYFYVGWGDTKGYL